MARAADRDGTRKVVAELNNLVTPKNPNLDKSFEKWWPDLEQQLAEARNSAGTLAPAKPSELEMMTEIFDWVRAQKRREIMEFNPSSEVFGALLGSSDPTTRAAAQIVLRRAATELLGRVREWGAKSATVTVDDDGRVRLSAADDGSDKPTS